MAISNKDASIFSWWNYRGIRGYLESEYDLSCVEFSSPRIRDIDMRGFIISVPVLKSQLLKELYGNK